MTTISYEKKPWLYLSVFFHEMESERDLDFDNNYEDLSVLTAEIELECWLKNIMKSNNDANVNNVIIVARYFKDVKNIKIEIKVKNEQQFDELIFTQNVSRPFIDTPDTETLLKFVKDEFDYDRIVIFTYGHGSIFGINTLEQGNLIDFLEKDKDGFFDFLEQFGIKYNEFLNIWKNKMQSFNDWRAKVILKNGSLVNPGNVKALNLTKIDQSITNNNVLQVNEFNFDNNIKPNATLTKPAAQPSFLCVEISKSLKSSFGKVDILAMVNCFMQNIFMQFSVKGTVDYLIAPISGISFPGYNICHLINHADNTIPTAQLAKEFVGDNIVMNPDFEITVNSIEVFKIALRDRWFVQVMDIVKYPDYSNALNSFFENLTQSAQSDKNLKGKINEAIFNCIKYSERSLTALHLIELKVFLVSLRKILKSNGYNNNSNYNNLFKSIADVNGLLSNLNSIAHYRGVNFFANLSHTVSDYYFKNDEIGFGIFVTDSFDTKGALYQMLDEYKRQSAVPNINMDFYIEFLSAIKK